MLPPTPETAAIFFGVWKLGAILLSMSVLYGDDSIRHRLSDSGAKLVVTGRGQRAALRPTRRRGCSSSTSDTLAGRLDRASSAGDTSAEDPAQLYYTSGTTGLAKGIVHAHRYILGHEEFVYCHEVADGERFHGMGEWAWAAGIAPLLGPWRLGAVQCVYRREAGFDPHKQLDFLSRHEVTNVFTTPTAMRAMMAIEDAGTRYPQQFRRVCSAGEPLNPEAIRWFREQYGVTVLDYYGLTESYPLVGELPVHGGPRGLDGQADARLGRPDPRRGRAARRPGRARRDLPARPHEPALPARLLERHRGGSDEVFGGEWFHTKRRRARRTRTATSGTTARADDVIIAAGYRIGPFEVESVCLEHPAVREAAAVASPDELRGNVVKAFIVLAADNEPSDEPRRRDQGVRPRAAVRVRLSAADRVRRRPAQDAHGKIRRIELRQLELERAGALRG